MLYPMTQTEKMLRLILAIYGHRLWADALPENDFDLTPWIEEIND